MADPILVQVRLEPPVQVVVQPQRTPVTQAVQSRPAEVAVTLAERGAKGEQGVQGPQGPVGPAGANYSLSAATKTTLGGVIVGDNLTVNNGTIAVPIATANTPGVVQIGANLTVNNGVLSANAGTVANLPWSNITGTPTTVAGYNITDAVTTLANVTHGNTTLPSYSGSQSANLRPFLGDYNTTGNTTTYAGFQTSGGVPSSYIGGGSTKIGNDILLSEILLNPSGATLISNRYTVNSSNQTTAIAYRYQFGIGSQGFQATVSGQVSGQINDAGIYVSPTGSYFDAGAFGSLDLSGDDVTVQTNQAEPGPLSVLNRMMADQLYQQVVRKN